MANSLAGKWGYTHNGEFFNGSFDTPEDAAQEGALEEGETVTVGRFRAPEVLAFVDAESVIERILCQDEYSGDWAENAIPYTNEQGDELTAMLQDAVRKWLDKHDLWPKFGIVEEERKITVPVEGGE